MKTFKILTLGILLTTAFANAQVSVSVNINAPAPAWIAAPVPSAQFYYLPDIQVYYDRPAAQFIYYGGGGWVRARHLPASYGYYNLNRGRTVCLTDYRGYAPYQRHNVYKTRYARPHYAPRRVAYVADRHHPGHHKNYYKKSHRKSHGRHHDH
ncbi:MAG: hypothetical protein EOO50_02330 [Flavobacterium sp.]|uniref:hypothetical protein n=1 Tax=Flavobacterium sp. TaxID=239 RepID=UPI00121B28C8|nr:hypothetical protein [Flavobacterium sp.]RZJ68277.1 MAG: hypothetical protein EOO50_02330 [Flavobacterium sp.]